MITIRASGPKQELLASHLCAVVLEPLDKQHKETAGHRHKVRTSTTRWGCTCCCGVYSPRAGTVTRTTPAHGPHRQVQGTQCVQGSCTIATAAADTEKGTRDPRRRAEPDPRRQCPLHAHGAWQLPAASCSTSPSAEHRSKATKGHRNPCMSIGMTAALQERAGRAPAYQVGAGCTNT